jgi:peroxiredoxin
MSIATSGNLPLPLRSSHIALRDGGGRAVRPVGAVASFPRGIDTIAAGRDPQDRERDYFTTDSPNAKRISVTGLRPHRSTKDAPMTLQTRLDAFKADFEAGKPPYNAPPSLIEPMHRATAELIASGAAGRARKVGDQAPAFLLKDPDGHAVSSADMLKQGPLVVTFYRGVWCPYCNMDMQALQEALPEIVRRGARLVAISPQTAANSRRSQRENEVEFPILSDPHNDVAASFGIRFGLPDYLVDLYKNTFKNNLALVNGDDSWTLPMPARFVIDQDGLVRYAEVNPDYTRRPDPSELFPVLDDLKPRQAA